MNIRYPIYEGVYRILTRVERYGDFTDVFFYSTRTDPYMGIAPDFSKLKAYNRYMYALSLVLGRDL